MDGHDRQIVGQKWDRAAMLARLVRYDALKPCFNAFIDTRSPGSEAKENFTIIGPGVSENPDQFVHIAEPHGFNIGGARQPPFCVNSQHSHNTAEVFIVHTGQWRFNLGEHGDDGQILAGPGDVISLPTNMFRGFTNVGEDTGYLFAVLGGDDPGHVLWAPYVFDMARDYGLVLLGNGQLIDQVAGQSVPDDAVIMPKTTPEQVRALLKANSEIGNGFIWRAQHSGADARIIGPDAKLNWEHGFDLDRLFITTRGQTDMVCEVPTVLFVQSGEASLAWDDGEIALSKGDTFTVPRHLPIRLHTHDGCEIYRVKGR
jgi:mannose-6-phosphate isomerase-like protein (cupin superfamily)